MKDHISKNLKKILEDLDLCKKFARLKTKEEVYRFLSHMDENITKEEFNKWLEDNINNKHDLLSVNELKKIAGGKSISKRVLSASLAALTLGAPGISAKGESKTFSSIQNSNTSIYRKLLFAGAAALGIPTAGLGAYILQKAVKDNAWEAKNSPPKKNLGSGGTTGNTEISGHGWPGGQGEDYTSKPFSGIYNKGDTCFANGLFQCLHSIPNLKEKLEPQSLEKIIEAQTAELNEIEKQIQQIKENIQTPLHNLQDILQKYNDKCLTAEQLEKMPIDGTTILKHDPLKAVIDLNYEEKELIDIKNNISQFSDCISQKRYKKIFNKYEFSQVDKTIITQYCAQINISTNNANQLLQQQTNLRLENTDRVKAKCNLLYQILDEMDKKNPKIPETKILADMSIKNYHGGQEDAEELFRGLSLPNSILSVKTLYGNIFAPESLECDAKNENAFIVRIANGGHKNSPLVNIPDEFIKDGNKFKLTCIAIHNGSASGGHYYAYRKDTKGNTGWWKCDDHRVNHECNDDSLLKSHHIMSQATLLTYVKDTQQDDA